MTTVCRFVGKNVGGRAACRTRVGALSWPPFRDRIVARSPRMTTIHITDIEAAINHWRACAWAPDGVALAPELSALAEVYGQTRRTRGALERLADVLFLLLLTGRVSSGFVMVYTLL